MAVRWLRPTKKTYVSLSHSHPSTALGDGITCHASAVCVSFRIFLKLSMSTYDCCIVISHVIVNSNPARLSRQQAYFWTRQSAVDHHRRPRLASHRNILVCQTKDMIRNEGRVVTTWRSIAARTTLPVRRGGTRRDYLKDSRYEYYELRQ
jgi:hypothetical protein